MDNHTIVGHKAPHYISPLIAEHDMIRKDYGSLSESVCRIIRMLKDCSNEKWKTALISELSTSKAHSSYRAYLKVLRTHISSAYDTWNY